MRFFKPPTDLVGRPRAVALHLAVLHRGDAGDARARPSSASTCWCVIWAIAIGSYLEIALAVVFIAFMGSLAWEGYKLTMLNRERLFGDSGLSYAYVTIAVPVGCLFLTLAMLHQWRGGLAGAPRRQAAHLQSR